MEFDLETLSFADRYKLLVSVVVPRPIAFVTTLSPQGNVNAAPYSFFNVLTHDPPMVAVGVNARDDGTVKDTSEWTRRSGEFVVNMVSEDIAEKMVEASTDFPPEVDELAMVGLTAAPSVKVKPPRIAESPVSLECRRHVILEFGPLRQLLIGEVLHVAIKDEMMLDVEKRYVDTPALKLVGRMHGRGWYTKTTDMVDIPRMSVEAFYEKHPEKRPK
ncbi:MAG: flavin reductase family protein [Acetobacterales bacterium]